MLKLALAAAGLLAALGSASAQHAQPYAGMQSREVKGLSEQQVADLRAGRGMGLALPAELNGYPGPMHVIELGQQLGLSPEQGAKMRTLFEAMKADAVPIGERLIRQEAELDALFRSKTVTPESLAAATGAIGATQAELRHAHLKYHLATVAVLTPDQVKRYGELRGYASRHGGGHHRHN
jgi:Spy/CpxP family protein refolding chaperone